MSKKKRMTEKKRRKKKLPVKKDPKSDPRRPRGMFCLWVPKDVRLVSPNSWNPVPDPQDTGDMD